MTNQNVKQPRYHANKLPFYHANELPFYHATRPTCNHNRDVLRQMYPTLQRKYRMPFDSTKITSSHAVQ